MHEFHAEKFVVPDGREPSLGALHLLRLWRHRQCP